MTQAEIIQAISDDKMMPFIQPEQPEPTIMTNEMLMGEIKPKKKSNALFDKCVENCDPAVMKEVSDNVDKMLGRQPAQGLDVTDFCKPVDPGIAKCVADHWWELLDDENAADKKAVKEIVKTVHKEVTRQVKEMVKEQPASEGLEKELEEEIERFYRTDEYCGFYECSLRTPLGGCPNGEKSEHSQIITTPDTRPYDLGHGPWDKGYEPSGINPTDFDGIKRAASDLVDAVERYMRQECLRSELAMKKETLKKLIER